MFGTTGAVVGRKKPAKRKPADNGKKKKTKLDGGRRWDCSEENLPFIAKFRNDVLSGNFGAVKETIKSKNVTGSQVDQIATLLIDRSSAEPTKEALLTAICVGSRPLVEFILPLFYEFPGEERNGCQVSSAFPPHITPLMLACICNNFGIVECLLLRNHSIILPHRPDCDCENCMREGDTLIVGVIRLDTYRAISSDAFLWLACADPLLAACWLAKDLEVCESIEEHSREIYRELRENLMKFSLKLIQQCWNMDEVDLVLSRKYGCSISDCSLRFPRARLALDCHMKYLMTSLNIQSAMKGEWCGSWTDYGHNTFLDCGRAIEHMLFYPFIAAVHAFTAGKLIKSFRNPVARYMSKMASYMVFLMVLVCVRYFGRSGDHASDRALRENGVEFGLECYVYLYMLGFIITHYQDFSKRGLLTYYRLWWRWFDLLLLWLFSGSFYCWIMTIAEVNQDGLYKLHRRHWVFYDFSLIYDVYFGGACIIAFWRLFYFVQLKRDIGSTVLSICRCARYAIVYLIIMAIVMLCFSLGINTLFQSYTGNKAHDKQGNLLEMKGTFADIIITFRNLYWAFYGYLGPWEYPLVIGNVGPNQELAKHTFTTIAAEVIIAVFHIVVIITLVNLMVAMLVRSADYVQQHEGIEWKYTRCQMLFEYFERSSSVPPPFNIIHLFTSTICRLLNARSFTCIFPDLSVQKNLVHINIEESREEELLYENLLKVLFGRFRSSAVFDYSTAQKAVAEKNLSSLTQPRGKLVAKPVLAFMNTQKPAATSAPAVPVTPSAPSTAQTPK